MRLRLAAMAPATPEIFRSLQGEGRTTGRVRVFIRLSGCNLACVWCDTAYTWNWRGSAHRHERDRPGAPHQFDPADEIVALTVEETARAALALGAPGYVITGGEPLVQASGVEALAAQLRDGRPDACIEVETNGTIAPSAALTRLVDLFHVSPKLAHSGNARARAIGPDALDAFAGCAHAVFKFVARDEADLDAIAALAEAHAIAPERILVMPEGTEPDVLDARARALAPGCLARGYGLSDRLHVRLFGAERGV